LFQKKSVLLMEAGAYDQLIIELSRQPEKFGLLHEVLQRKNNAAGKSSLSEKELALYLRHLLAALMKMDHILMQQALVDKAAALIENLPDGKQRWFYEQLMMQVGRNKPVYTYINGLSQRAINLPA
jgi:hypothetical protein